jgi:hypothetical protein
MLSWDWYGFDKKHNGTRYAKLEFFYLVGSAGHIVNFFASELRKVVALFFILGWVQYGFHKKNVGTCYADLLLLHPVGYAGHVVHSGAPVVQNINAQFFMLGGPSAVSIKSALGHVTPNLCFCIQLELWVT